MRAGSGAATPTWRPPPGGVAAGLRGLGISTGDVVSVQLPNWYETVVVAVAIQIHRGGHQPAAPQLPARELTHVFTTAHPAAIVTPADYRGCDHRRLVEEVSAATGVRPRQVVARPPADARVDVRLDDLLHGPAVALEPAAAPAAAVSELIFTSGTEASPKAIMHTEQTTNFSVRVAFDDLQLHADDVVWMPSPVGHSTGFNYGLRFALYHGLPLDPPRSLGRHRGARPRGERGSQLHAGRDDLPAGPRRGGPPPAPRLPRLRCFGCGGAPVPAELVEAASDVGIGVLRLYGSTEVLVGTWNRPGSPPEQRRHTDGVAMTDVEIETRDRRRDALSRRAGRDLRARAQHLRRLLRRP